MVPSSQVRYEPAMQSADVGVRERGVSPSATARWVGLFGISDLLILSFLTTLRVIVGGANPMPTRTAHELELMIVLLVGACLFGRGATSVSPRVRTVIYRLIAVGTIPGTYLTLRELLPAVRHDSVDAALHALDVRLFGVEPTLFLERFTTPAVVEYFSFFYFSYFTLNFVMAAGVFGFNRCSRAANEFAIGCALVFGLGQLGYIAVPAFGPIHHLVDTFQQPLSGGFFYRCMMDTVHAGGAMKDVFPSLHTAVPTWFTLYLWRRASQEGAHRAWRVGAVVMTVFATNIVISTVVLRWHYLIDVFAGLTLAFSAWWVAPRIAARELAIRERVGLGDAWRF